MWGRFLLILKSLSLAKIAGLTVNDLADLKPGTRLIHYGRPAKFSSEPVLEGRYTIVYRIEITYRDHDGFAHTTARYTRHRKKINWKTHFRPRYPRPHERLLLNWW